MLETLVKRLNLATVAFLCAGIVEGVMYLISAIFSVVKAYEDCSSDYDFLSKCHIDQLNFQSDFTILLSYSIFYFSLPCLAILTGNIVKVFTVLITSIVTIAFAAYRCFNHTELVYNESYFLLGISISCTLCYAATIEYIVRRLPYEVSPNLPQQFKRYIFSQTLSGIFIFLTFFSLSLYTVMIAFVKNNSWLSLFVTLNFIVVPSCLVLATLFTYNSKSRMLALISFCPILVNLAGSILILSYTIGHEDDHTFLIDSYPFVPTLILSSVTLLATLIACYFACRRFLLGTTSTEDYSQLTEDEAGKEPKDEQSMRTVY